MKASATQYAKALYELTKDKQQPEVDAAVSNFAKELNKNGQLKLAENIIEKFREIYNAENGIVEVQVISRAKLSGELRNMLRSKVGTKYGAKEVVLKNVVDKNIKGGVIVKVGDEVTDGTVDRQLMELKKELSG